MRKIFILKAHKSSSDKCKKEIEEEYPEFFNFPLRREHLKIGRWYKVTHLVSGCQGFNGLGRRVNTPGLSHNGLLSTEVGVNLEQIDGRIWKVKGIYSIATAKDLIKAKKPLLL